MSTSPSPSSLSLSTVPSILSEASEPDLTENSSRASTPFAEYDLNSVSSQSGSEYDGDDDELFGSPSPQPARKSLSVNPGKLVCGELETADNDSGFVESEVSSGHRGQSVSDLILAAFDPSSCSPPFHQLPDGLIDAIEEMMQVRRNGKPIECAICRFQLGARVELGTYTVRHMKEIHGRTLAAKIAEGTNDSMDDALMICLVAAHVRLPRSQPRPTTAEKDQATAFVEFMQKPAECRRFDVPSYDRIDLNSRHCASLMEKCNPAPRPCEFCGRQFGRK